MARQDVIQVQCDRCKRVELLPPTQKRTEPIFKVRLGNNEIVYDDICGWCMSALTNYMENIRQWEREIKQHFGPTIQDDKAAPLIPAPDYSPPKPHSLHASTKK